MRRLVVGAMATALGLGVCGSALAEPDAALERLEGAAASCIRANAANVERAEPQLTDAAEFLVRELCSEPVRTYDRYVANTKRLRLEQIQTVFSIVSPHTTSQEVAEAFAQARKNMEAQRAEWARVTVDPETGEFRIPADAPDIQAYDALESDSETAPDTLAIFRSIAAQAVLASRTSRLASH